MVSSSIETVLLPTLPPSSLHYENDQFEDSHIADDHTVHDHNVPCATDLSVSCQDNRADQHAGPRT